MFPPTSEAPRLQSSSLYSGWAETAESSSGGALVFAQRRFFCLHFSATSRFIHQRSINALGTDQRPPKPLHLSPNGPGVRWFGWRSPASFSFELSSPQFRRRFTRERFVCSTFGSTRIVPKLFRNALHTSLERPTAFRGNSQPPRPSSRWISI
jgi:hypothetical protein